MDKFLNFFLLIRPNHFALCAIDENYEILFKEELFLSDETLEPNPNIVKKFLDDNIFKLEKNFNSYIEDINLIIDHKNFIKINLSLIKNFKYLFKQNDNYLNDLSNIKDSVLRNNNNYELTHMIINKFIVDKKDFIIELDANNQKDIFLEIGMICLKKSTINSFKKILSNYQIFIKNTLCFEYVNSFKTVEVDNISVVAYKLINGLNLNEINFSKKNPKKIGFFEKFFKIFS